MAALYGSNRTLDIAIDALVPMIIELGTIERVKKSLYAKAPNNIITHPIITEMIIFADIKLSGSKSILVEDLQFRPWYMFFQINLGDMQNFSLFKYTESGIGQGYLTI